MYLARVVCRREVRNDSTQQTWGNGMALPNIHKHDKSHWERLHNSAETDDGRAVVGALMLVVLELEAIRDAILEQGSDSAPRIGE